VIGQVQDGGLTLTNEVYGEIEHPVNPAFTIYDLTTTRWAKKTMQNEAKFFFYSVMEEEVKSAKNSEK
jgi:hypothetical protein